MHAADARRCAVEGAHRRPKAALVETPLVGHPIMRISDHGCVAQLPRGPQRSRFYVQCELGDGAADWPDERVWSEIRLRLCNSEIANAKVIDTSFVAIRSAVHAPMQYRNLFLAGDAAHIVPPTSAKGMSLALYDVDVLAQALASGDRTARFASPTAARLHSEYQRGTN